MGFKPIVAEHETVIGGTPPPVVAGLVLFYMESIREYTCLGELEINFLNDETAVKVLQNRA